MFTKPAPLLSDSFIYLAIPCSTKEASYSSGNSFVSLTYHKAFRNSMAIRQGSVGVKAIILSNISSGLLQSFTEIFPGNCSSRLPFFGLKLLQILKISRFFKAENLILLHVWFHFRVLLKTWNLYTEITAIKLWDIFHFGGLFVRLFIDINFITNKLILCKEWE